MRLGSVLSEALRNIGSGVSRAFAMFLAVPYWKNRYFKKKGDANHG